MLHQRHLQELRDSAISDSIIEQAGFYSETDPKALLRIGCSDGQSRCVPCLVIPNYSLCGVCYQIKPDKPFRDDKGKPVKYMTVRSGHVGLAFLPHLRCNVLDSSEPLWITEGMKKAAAAASVGIVCISLAGVWMWQKKDEEGESVPYAEWDQIPLDGRRIFLCFDSDAMTKSEVHNALKKLMFFLNERGAIVKIVYLPDGEQGDKIGIDDYLAAGHSLNDLYELAENTLHPLIPDISQEVVKSIQRKVKGYAEVTACGVTFASESVKAVDKVMHSLTGAESQVRGVTTWIRGDAWITMKKILPHGQLWSSFAAKYGFDNAKKAADAARICRKFPFENRRKGAIPYWVFQEIATTDKETQDLVLDIFALRAMSCREVREVVGMNGTKLQPKTSDRDNCRDQKGQKSSTFLHEVQDFLDLIPAGEIRELTWFVHRKGYIYIKELIECEKRLAEAQDAARVHEYHFGRNDND